MVRMSVLQSRLRLLKLIFPAVIITSFACTADRGGCAAGGYATEGCDREMRQRDVIRAVNTTDQQKIATTPSVRTQPEVVAE